MDYLIYFLGPLILGVVGAKLLCQRATVFVIGLTAFLVAWVVMQASVSLATRTLHLVEGTFLFGLVVSFLAATCEETTRFLVFRRFRAFRGRPDWSSSTMFALGHHGMETVIVGLTLLLLALVMRYAPGSMADPAALKQCQELLSEAPAYRLGSALERLLVGLLVQACFSGVVMLGFVRSQVRWVLVAGLWHFAHDMIGHQLYLLSDHWLVSKVWVAIIVVVYTAVFVRLCRAMPPPPHHAPDSGAAHPSVILPGR